MHRLSGILATLLLVPAAALSQPASGKPSLGFVVEGTVEMGGDRFGETVFTTGETQTMRTGQGGTLSVGGELRNFAPVPLAIRATAGFKFVTTAAENADIMLTRIPIEIVGSYHFTRDWHAGAGFVRHSRIRFDGDDFAPNVGFADANGITAEAGWRWVSLSYTKLDYTDDQGNVYDAGSVGLTLTWRR